MVNANRPESLPPDKLQYHPKSIEIYGQPDPSDRFVDDIGENGVEQPITVTEDSHFTDGIAVISGNKRTEAADRTDRDLPIGAWKEYDTPGDEVAAVLRYNDYRDKSFSQRMGEADSIKEIVEASAEGRMQNPMQDFAEGDDGLTRDKIAKRVGFGSGETYRKASKVWDSAQSGNESAQHLVEEIDAENESIHSAYTLYKDVIDDDVVDKLEKWAINGVIDSGQAQLLNSVWDEYFLFDLTVDHNLSVDELEDVIHDLEHGKEVVSIVRDWPIGRFDDTDEMMMKDALEEAEVPDGDIMSDLASSEMTEALLWMNENVAGFSTDIYENKGWEPQPVAFTWELSEVTRGMRRIDLAREHGYEGDMEVEIQFYRNTLERDDSASDATIENESKAAN